MPAAMVGENVTQEATVMFPHPDTVIDLAFMRHQERQTENECARLAALAAAAQRARPGIVDTMRRSAGAVLIGMGTHLQGMTESGRPATAFGSQR